MKFRIQNSEFKNGGRGCHSSDRCPNDRGLYSALRTLRQAQGPAVRPAQATVGEPVEPPHSALRSGFTLAELLVVVAIIGLLVAILVPALGGARTQAKIVATQSLQSSLSVSLDSFKQESRLSGSYPPSASDTQGLAAQPREIQDPFKLNPAPQLRHTTGSSLLVYAMRGADGLGTPGFLDIDGDQLWSDDFGHMAQPPATHGAHEINPTTGDPMAVRYGPYAATDPLIKSIQPLGSLIDKGTVLAPQLAWDTQLDKGDYKHLVFTDSWSHPILYYRARSAARAIVPWMSGSTVTPGVFDPVDNASIVGDLGIGGTTVIPGLEFRVGQQHRLANVQRDLQPNSDPRVFDPTASGVYLPGHDASFERYVWDSKVTGRVTAVNKDSYLLISAGPDAVYGTPDDVTNFGKN